MINLHTKFYQLRTDPFRLSSDHRFSFGHKSYKNAISYLKFGFYSGEGFIVVTGRPGSGKTTLINQIISEIDTRTVEVGNLVTTQYESHDLLNMIAASFNLDMDSASKSSILLALEKFLKRKHAEGKRVLLIVDEAQGLTLDSLEVLRQLSNFQVDSTPLLQIFLIGQEEFRDLIESPGMEQLRQRIVVSSRLEPLTETETLEYVTHRLKHAGWKGNPAITRSAVLIVHHYSSGIPRIINLICGRLLLYGCTGQKHELDAQDMKSVIEELSDELLVIDDDISLEEIVEKLKFSDEEYLSTNVEEESSVSDSLATEGDTTVAAKADNTTTDEERHFKDNTASKFHDKTVKKVDNHDLEQIDELSQTVFEKELEQEIIVPVEPDQKRGDGDTSVQAAHNEEPKKTNSVSITTMVAVLVGLIAILSVVIPLLNGSGNSELIANDNQSEVAKVPVNKSDKQAGSQLLPDEEGQNVINQESSNKASRVQPSEVDTVKSDHPSPKTFILSNQDKASKKLPQPAADMAIMPKQEAVKEVKQVSDVSVPEASLQIKEEVLAESEKSNDLKPRIDDLLKQADQQLRKKQLMTPVEDSAWQTYQEILSLDPGNEQALAGNDNITQTYVIWARDQAIKGNVQHSKFLFNKALEISPEYKDALSGLAELETNKQQEQPE